MDAVFAKFLNACASSEAEIIISQEELTNHCIKHSILDR